MALGTISRVVTSPEGSAERAGLVANNAALAALRVLCVKLDADAGVTDTNYTAILDASTGVNTILNVNGNTITEP